MVKNGQVLAKPKTNSLTNMHALAVISSDRIYIVREFSEPGGKIDNWFDMTFGQLSNRTMGNRQTDRQTNKQTGLTLDIRF